MFPNVPETWRWHDISCGVYALSGSEEAVKNIGVQIAIKTLPGRCAASVGQFLPCLNAIEELEENCAKEDLFWNLRAAVDDVADQVLADSVRCTIDISESMCAEDLVCCPGRITPCHSLHEHMLALSCKAPVGLKDGCGS